MTFYFTSKFTSTLAFFKVRFSQTTTVDCDRAMELEGGRGGGGTVLTWIIRGQGSTVLAVGAGGGCLDTFLSSVISLFFLPLSGKRSI